MNPVIEPNIFWCAEIYGCLKIVMLIATLCLVIVNIAFFIECELDPLFIGIMILTAILFVITPSESTYYKMSIAKYITADNIEMFESNTKELIDYITNAILNDKDTKK